MNFIWADKGTVWVCSSIVLFGHDIHKGMAKLGIRFYYNIIVQTKIQHYYCNSLSCLLPFKQIFPLVHSSHFLPLTCKKCCMFNYWSHSDEQALTGNIVPDHSGPAMPPICLFQDACGCNNLFAYTGHSILSSLLLQQLSQQGFPKILTKS